MDMDNFYCFPPTFLSPMKGFNMTIKFIYLTMNDMFDLE